MYDDDICHLVFISLSPMGIHQALHSRDWGVTSDILPMRP